MKMNFKEISILFSLLFILMISLAVVSAEEISDSDDLSLNDDSESINSEYENDLNIETAELDSSNQESNLNDESSGILEANAPETDVSQSSDEILGQSNEENNNVLADGNNGYSISVSNIEAIEGTNVNIVAKVSKNGASVSSGTVLFALWTANGNPVSKNVTVSNGQAVLNINLPKASEVSYYNWICKHLPLCILL